MVVCHHGRSENKVKNTVKKSRFVANVEKMGSNDHFISYTYS